MKTWRPAFLMTLVYSAAWGAGSDPPALVGRLGYVDGPVWMQSAADRSRAWTNWPLTSGDAIRTAEGRAELDLGMVMVRLDQGSDVAILELDEAVTRLQIASGAATLHVRELPGSDAIRLQLNDATVELRGVGLYRVDVSRDEVRVVVRSGEAGISTSKARFQQFSREQARLELDGTVTLTTASSADAFEDWSLKRAQNAERAESALHVAKGLIGHEDLDAYGEWHWERAYGMVWKPQKVSREWAPYRFGHWIWKAPWGWTWIEDAPWGFAPSHYGRWINTDEQWLWVPGPRQLPPVYVPAMVGWTEHPAEEDRVGWFPLGPGEAYVPPYPASDLYERRVNTFSAVSSRASFETEPAPRTITWAAASAFTGHPLPRAKPREVLSPARGTRSRGRSLRPTFHRPAS
jgi:hypothetical protein